MLPFVEGTPSVLTLWRLGHVRTTGTAVAGACSAPNKEMSAWLGLVLLMGHLGLWDPGPWESLFLYAPYHWRKEAEGRGPKGKGSVRPPQESTSLGVQ